MATCIEVRFIISNINIIKNKNYATLLEVNLTYFKKKMKVKNIGKHKLIFFYTKVTLNV